LFGHGLETVLGGVGGTRRGKFDAERLHRCKELLDLGLEIVEIRVRHYRHSPCCPPTDRRRAACRHHYRARHALII